MEQTLRPLTLGELLDRSFTIFRRHFLLFVGISAIPGLFPLALSLVQAALGEDSILLTLLLTMVRLVVVVTSVMVAQGATIVAVSQIQLGRQAGIQESFQTIRPMLGSLVGTGLMYGFLILIGFILLIVPGIIVAVRWALVIPVAVLEHRTGFDATSRSADLTAGHRWRVFFVYLILVLLVYFVVFLVGIPLFLLFGVSDPENVTRTGLVVQAVLGFLSSALISPILTVGLTVLYYDIRIRKEAFDLENMMAQLDQTSPAPAL